jgi:hypothetical protein
MIISFEEPPSREQFDSEEDYQKAYNDWKKAFDSAMEKYGNISNN